MSSRSNFPFITLFRVFIFSLPIFSILAIDLPFRLTTQDMQTSSFDNPRLVFSVLLFLANRGNLKSL
jgi:hypothetical protein